MTTLSTVALPKSTAGRRSKPLDETFGKALVAAVKKSGANVDANGNRPFHTSSDRFATKGKASADGRRYANLVAAELKLEKVSVRVYPDGKEFGWGIYLPMPSEDATAENAS